VSDAIPLPPSPDLDHYRTLARELKHACARDAVAEWAGTWLRRLAAHAPLDDWAPSEAAVDRAVARVDRLWRQLRDRHRLTACRLADARFFLARVHGFASWPRFVEHLSQLATPGTAAAFEAAVDAVVDGDLDALRALVARHPDLVRMRSSREHHSTLLHYVSANGVEDYRQKTPPNIVAIARLLLDAGADVNAESEAYGGHSTTLGLTATSIHPERAGVQLALIDLLVARGANLDQRGQAGNGHGAVVGSLANGQGDAARHLADHGAALDLEGAGGIGRIEVLRRFVSDDGSLRDGATADQFASAFMYACGYGREEAVRFLLDRGADPNYRNEGGETPLHWTVFGPHDGVAALLLERGARVDVRDTIWQATPLDRALYFRARSDDPAHREAGLGFIARLVAAGGVPDLSRFDPKTRAVLEGDARLMAIVRGAAPGSS
jgi:ankyrin repeat protein